MQILLISDIHGNYPALEAVWRHFAHTTFDAILNCGDSLVYAPFPNETLNWLQQHKVHSILGNTDRKIIRLLKGKNFKKPSKEEKRVMYHRTASILTKANSSYLCGLKKKHRLRSPRSGPQIGIYHGSPEDPDEFLFDTTAQSRFAQLAGKMKKKGIGLVVTGHSHTPYHKQIGQIHFINPGSVGRMFDGNPQASCAVLHIDGGAIGVRHYRLEYPVEQVIQKLRDEHFPDIYCRMYQAGRKLH